MNNAKNSLGINRLELISIPSLNTNDIVERIAQTVTDLGKNMNEITVGELTEIARRERDWLMTEAVEIAEKQLKLV